MAKSFLNTFYVFRPLLINLLYFLHPLAINDLPKAEKFENLIHYF